LNEVIDSRDVLPSQKLGMAGFMARKVYRHSRAAKIHIPLLLAVIYLLACVVHPPLWIWFDRNPANLELAKTGFVVTNADGHPLWSKEGICPDFSEDETKSLWLTENLDADPKNEVLFLPHGNPRYYCEKNARLLVYDDDGDSMFERQCEILGEYPRDSSDSLHYYSISLRTLDLDDRKVIMTTVGTDYPSRAHHKFWSLDGELLGWYVHAGYGGGSGKQLAFDSRGRLLLFHNNNRTKQAGLCALYPDSAYGVSPPYTDSEYDLSWVKRGNQICYISFPRSDMSMLLRSVYNTPYRLRIESDRIRADVAPAAWGAPGAHGLLSYFIDSRLRVYSISPEDRFGEVWDSLSRAGALPNPDLGQHLDELLSRVSYWTDSGWVTEGELRAAEADSESVMSTNR
jgi:hypothetical protein